MVSDKAFIIAGTALVVGTLFGLASPTLAANEAEPKVTKTIIIRHHDGAEGVREEKDIVIADCADGGRKFVTDNEATDGNGQVRKSKIVICGAPGLTDADMAKKLSEARARIAKDMEAAGDAREKALAALDKEIARLNGPHKDYPKE
ncbi:MAG: hypothetical protein RIQ75_1040 [Pseudomonadota bacterium]|jgi:hypothetical protein